MGISLGLVGLGAFGSAFAGLFKSHPLVSRIALCDREAERVKRFAEDPTFQDKFNPRDAYASLEEVCKADLDALAIITQPWLHAPQCVQAMESGKHVYSAVPVIELPDGDEILDWCDRLVSTCRRTGMRYMLGETTFYRPETMFCRRKAAEGAFGHIVYGEGEYLHDVDSPSNLRRVRAHRLAGKAGQEWIEASRKYRERGILDGPMHYPTHSVSGPVSVMKAHMTRVCAFGYRDPDRDEYYGDSFSNETALFQMSNGAIVRICEFRQIGHTNQETVRIFGSEASFHHNTWVTLTEALPVSEEEMRDKLPEEVYRAFLKHRMEVDGREKGGAGVFYHDADFAASRQDARVYGGHGGSHAFLVHEFVSAVSEDRQPAVNAWEAARYMAAGVMAHKSALRDGELLDVPDWGDAPQ
jgi:predicted dehydrogenase